jgi:MoxR-like ATPase
VVDRADEEFEAFLLEVLSDNQVSIPELGTLRAERPPRALLTSNDTRELSEALRRRCLYLYIDYPSLEDELRIVERRVPGLSKELVERLVRFAQAVRRGEIRKVPGIAEVVDWALALTAVGADSLSTPVLRKTLGVLLKSREDLEAVLSDLGRYRA